MVSVVLTLGVRRWALRRGFVDHPGQRKIHANPIALGGGIVVFWVTLLPPPVLTLLAWWWQRGQVPGWAPASLVQHVEGLADKGQTLLLLIAAAAGLHVMGLIDDKRRLGPWVKLGVQVGAAALLAIWGEIRFEFFIGNVWAATALSILWMVVIINAFNFLDNMDGLSAGIAAICAAMILSAALGNGQMFVSGLLVLLIGALLGFLVFNFSPAKIFLGDGGSLVVGLLIAVATIHTTYYHEDGQSGHWYATLMPLIVLAVPLYDFISVVALRLLQGASPFVGDTQHFSHRLVKRGMSHRQAVVTIYLATACTGLGATFLHQLSTAGAMLVFVQTVLILLIIAILEKPERDQGHA